MHSGDRSTPFRVAVVIPARNEAPAIALVIAEIPSWVGRVVVADNGSVDATAAVALAAGAEVVAVPTPGYGRACLAGIARARAWGAQVIVFLDGDFSDYPAQMDRLVAPIRAGTADMVIGSRLLGTRAPGAFTLQQRFGNGLACLLIRWWWSFDYTDLGPFRAIRTEALVRLDMRELTYGWTAEMQVKALQRGLRVCEAPVDYRPRIGRSKVSGTVRGVVLAGYHILSVIGRAMLAERALRRRARVTAAR